MRNLFAIVSVLLFLGCSTDTDEINLIEGDPTVLIVTVEYEMDLMANKVKTGDSGSNVYYFENFEFRTLNGGDQEGLFTVHYNYVGEGVFKHVTTGDEVIYTKKGIADALGKVKFTNTPRSNHTVVAESNNVNGKKSWVVVNTKNSNNVNFFMK
ncbi:hypothetical protein [Alkaliflexus imshenetskii]|uniref:hypothetical protein n=1 Tax=Alkaliflexus imshenetskii TaxID=286730 RepID=UPI00047D27A4|nr:hypothetical protein [Alkaliflexus imshenetskii]